MPASGSVSCSKSLYLDLDLEFLCVFGLGGKFFIHELINDQLQYNAVETDGKHCRKIQK